MCTYVGTVQRVEVGHSGEGSGIGRSIFDIAKPSAHALCRALTWMEMATIQDASAILVDDIKSSPATGEEGRQHFVFTKVG